MRAKMRGKWTFHKVCLHFSDFCINFQANFRNFLHNSRCVLQREFHGFPASNIYSSELVLAHKLKVRENVLLFQPLSKLKVQRFRARFMKEAIISHNRLLLVKFSQVVVLKDTLKL